MNTKCAFLVVSVVLLAAFAGVAVMGDAYAEEGVTGESGASTPSTPTTYIAGSVSYTVGDRVYSVPLSDAEKTGRAVVLKTINDLGAQADTGMQFDCWEYNSAKYAAGSTLIMPSATTESDAEVPSLVAKFTPVTYTATFKDASGEVVKAVTGSIKDVSGLAIDPKDLSVEAPVAPAVEGKIFAGWLAEGAEKAVVNADLGKLTADIVYTATYVIDYKVTFIDNDKTYITKVSDLVIPDVGERTGFTFLGWFVGIEQVADPAAYDFRADTVFEAKWEPVNVFVTFAAGSYSKVVPVLYGETVVVPEVPAGYTGWGIETEEGVIAFDFTTPITSDMTIVGIAAPPAEPTGMSNPIVMTAAIVGAVIVLALLAAFVMAVKKGKIVIGLNKASVVKSDEEEPKE